MQEEKSAYGKKYSGHEKSSTDGLTVAQTYRPPGVATRRNYGWIT